MISLFSSLALASDHAGFILKETLKPVLTSLNVSWVDLGASDESSVDYPDFAARGAHAILSNHVEAGIFICGTGLGISIAANRIKGIRATPCESATAAALARRHNNANVLCLGARLIGVEVAEDCLRTFLTTSFSDGERHLRRILKLDS